MTAPAPYRIIAQVSEAEGPAVRTGAEFLVGALNAAPMKTPLSLQLAFAPADALPESIPAAQLYILSMRTGLARPRTTREALMQAWSERIRALQQHGAPILLCTVFRHVRERGADDTLARIRDLNLVAIRLSQALGVRIVDLDRVLSHFGERIVRADHGLNHPRATDTAGFAIAGAILASAPDEVIDPLEQERARQALGNLETFPRILRQREERRQQQAEAPRG